MGKQKYSLRVEFPLSESKKFRHKAFLREIKLAALVRVLMAAWTRGDERAEGIVLDWEAAQMRKE